MAEEELVAAIRATMKRLANERGPFNLVMLVSEDPAVSDRFTLIISATWLDPLPVKEALDLLIKELRKDHIPEKLSSVTTMAIRQTSSPFVKAMNAMFRVENGSLLQAAHLNLGDDQLDEVRFIASGSAPGVMP